MSGSVYVPDFPPVPTEHIFPLVPTTDVAAIAKIREAMRVVIEAAEEIERTIRRVEAKKKRTTRDRDIRDALDCYLTELRARRAVAVKAAERHGRRLQRLIRGGGRSSGRRRRRNRTRRRSKRRRSRLKRRSRRRSARSNRRHRRKRSK